jgi:glycine betaine/proline transport system ATP-binding protein
MEGGRIVQCGTPQEIFSAPANGYVADFVQHMNPLGVLTAGDVMVPVAGEVSEIAVASDVEIESVMETVLQDPKPVIVEEAGTPVGMVTRDSLLKRLVGLASGKG